MYDTNHSARTQSDPVCENFYPPLSNSYLGFKVGIEKDIGGLEISMNN